MAKNEENASRVEESPKARVTHVKRILNGKSVKSPTVPTVPIVPTPADITLSLTGKRDNRLIHSLGKSFYELVVELTKGHINAEQRFVRRYEAAALLFPEDMRKLRGQTVKIK